MSLWVGVIVGIFVLIILLSDDSNNNGGGFAV